MAEMRASPVKSQALKRLADIVRSVEQGGEMEFLPFNPMSLFPVSSSTLENLAYGNLPMAIPSQSNIPITKTGRKQEVAELAGLTMMAPSANRGVNMVANTAGDAMVRFITGNPRATAMGVLDEAGAMTPLNRIFVGQKSTKIKPEQVAVAEELEKRGASPERIWRETQLARLPAGREWVTEISDDMARLDFEGLPPARERFDIANAWLQRNNYIPDEKKGVWGVGSSSDLVPQEAQDKALAFADDIIASGGNLEPRPLERYFQHQALREAYPGATGSPGLLARLDIAREPAGSPHRGMYKEKQELVTTGGGNMIGGGDVNEAAKSTMIHELQHAVQSAEGHGRGGMPITAPSQLYHAERNDPILASNLRAYHDFKQNLGDLGLASKAQYMHKLDAIARGEGIRPRSVYNMQDWYAYGHEYRGIAGPQPKRAGPARDEWFRGAAAFIKNKVQEKDPSYRFAQQDYTPEEAKKMAASANRKVSRLADKANEYRTAQTKYNKLNELVKKSEDYELYKRLEGEAIARLAQTRMNLTPAERAANFPFAQRIENAGFNRETYNPYGLDVDPMELFVYRY